MAYSQVIINGAAVATDAISNKQYQLLKMAYGAEGISTPVDNTNPFPVSFPSSQLDAAGRARVVAPVPIMEFSQPTDIHASSLWDTDVNLGGAGAFQANKSSYKLSNPTTLNAHFIRQTIKRFRYEPGKAMEVEFSLKPNNGVPNLLKRWGLYDGEDGFVWQVRGATLAVGHLSKVTGSVVENIVNQDQWNLDKLDGNGPSGVTIAANQHLGRVHRFHIDFQYPGRTRFGVIFDSDISYVHQIDNTNVDSELEARTAHLPVRFEINNVGELPAAADYEFYNFSVSSSGRGEYTGIPHSADSGVTSVVRAGAGVKPLLSIRLKAGEIQHVIERVIPTALETAGGRFNWVLILNPTSVTGTPPSWTSIAGSAIEYDLARDGSITGGNRLASGYATGILDHGRVRLLNRSDAVGLGSKIDGTPVELILAVEAVSGTGNFLGGLSWAEV